MTLDAPQRQGHRGAERSPARGPLRIAFCIDTLEVGGTELNAVRTAERLIRTAVELSVFHLQEDGPLLARYRDTGADLFHLPLDRLVGLSAMARGVELARLLRRRRIEILHAHDVYSNVLGVPWARIAGLKGTIASRRWTDSLPRRDLGVANAWASRMAHRVLANSRSVVPLMIKEGIAPERIVVLPNFLDDSAYAEWKPEERITRRLELGIPPDALVVGTVARLVPEKGLGILMEAFARVSPQLEAHLVVIGEGAERRALAERAESLGVSGRVRLTGTRIKPWNLHGLFDVSVLASLSEGFPNSVIEGMAAGCPIVATLVGGVAEAITDLETGLLVQPGDVAALTAALDRLLSDVELARALGARARRDALTRYHGDAVLDQLGDLYGSLVADG